ncbi:MAG: hypothetical protein A3K06_01625 [Candidatus Doudnabacteria bacterium RIFCSPHIGHO2_01_52_17]|uniref:GlcNAc-PI de-N-acetylase n=1 Tax=Candidatus Doudnabacteria bacterium RIFCSPHIGHO2_01_52_17 TaxID=1817820 RepID=A0A1F5NA93_9BACT|nr:MAG: hypothetical protein A3K06_01625 [Candidatus Doudnabacteria bacterium RIFCSPHIGHO2_01_52_17]
MNKNKVLVIAAHPDDEVLGAGGTMLKHKKAGDEITVLILGEGETSRSSADIEKRERQAREATAALGAKAVLFERFPDQRFDTIALLDVVQKIERVVEMTHPDIVYTHCPYDLNMDHRIIFQATATALRPGPTSSAKKFLTFEVLSSTEWQIRDQANSFSPTVYEDISDFIEEKIKIFQIYRDEVRDYPHPRSTEGIKIQAKYRGMQVGFQYAEAFQLIRMRNS